MFVVFMSSYVTLHILGECKMLVTNFTAIRMLMLVSFEVFDVVLLHSKWAFAYVTRKELSNAMYACSVHLGTRVALK